MAALAYPFICLPEAALWKPGLSKQAKCLFSALIAYRNRKTGKCTPKLAALAQRLETSISTIKRALAELRRAGMVVIHRSLWGNRYDVTTPDQWQAADTATPHDPEVVVSFSSSVIPAVGSPVIPRMAHGCALSGAASLYEPDAYEPKGAADAVPPVSTCGAAAAAAAPPPPRVPPTPNASASPEAASAPPPKPAEHKPPVVLPDVRIPALALAMADKLLEVHPQPGLAERAAPAIESILRGAENLQDVAETIWTNHGAWMEYWRTLAAGRFIPQLWRWLRDGDWKRPPVIRKPMTKTDQLLERYYAQEGRRKAGTM